MPNKIKQAWSEGRATINGWLAIPDGFAAETMAQAGWDSVTVDLQHGVQDYLSMVRCFQAMQSHPVVPMVRVPWNEPGIIGKVLDAGAYGIICPMINTPEEAKNFISYCKYPPMGARSNGPIRAGIYGTVGPGGGYQSTANDEIICLPMIETQQAIDNLGAILDTPGIDAVYIGPSDLGFSMGLPPKLDRDEPQIMKIYETIIAETNKRGQKACVHCLSPNYATKMIDMGFSLVTLGNDSGLLLTAATAAVKAARRQ